MTEHRKPLIRLERSEDTAQIRAITEAAFKGKPYAAGDEHELVGALRDHRALSLSLVAELDREVIGQITFSPAATEDDSKQWFALGPVSVAPAHQSQGIGSMLINQGLAIMLERGATGCVLTGNPVYYQRFGFVLAPQQAPDDSSRPHFMIKPLAGAVPDAVIAFHPLFDS